MTDPDVFLLVKERVAHGVAWLHTQDADWRSKVDRATFDIYDPRLCILGQVFNDKASVAGYDYAFDHLGMVDYIANGFDADYTIRYDYGALQHEWLKVLDASLDPVV